MQEYQYYPASDLRFSVNDGGVTRYFAYDGGNVVEEYNGAMSLDASYVEGPGLDAHVARVTRDGKVYAYVTDPLGTVRVVADEYGWKQCEYTYTAFGEQRSVSSFVENEFGFTGRRLAEKSPRFAREWS